MEYLIHHVKFEMWPLLPVLTQAVFNVGTAFGRDKIGAQKIKKTIFFQDKFYSVKAHAHYFTVLIYLVTWRAAKLGIFTHFTSINLLLNQVDLMLL